ncbi:hypothetical protein E4U41_004837 [Claviceps citrina]|nr:hypothetical protein E4U41_004837 [Claviceps citrina]
MSRPIFGHQVPEQGRDVDGKLGNLGGCVLMWVESAVDLVWSGDLWWKLVGRSRRPSRQHATLTSAFVEFPDYKPARGDIGPIWRGSPTAKFHDCEAPRLPSLANIRAVWSTTPTQQRSHRRAPIRPLEFETP